ncbi:hypothetical protein [Algoriphagus sp. PAP.12]|uniref:hypothetical protein n=1 Tax=Algoriphagus sp. PAP.12 TaxID=2996678 RepID=UPI00227BEB01|nr:hypothetical protein [Algoriphagus sp. PAP.12]
MQRAIYRKEELSKIKPLILEKRMKMSRLGTRKLHHLLGDKFKEMGIKLGRDALFSYLRDVPSQNKLNKSKNLELFL